MNRRFRLALPVTLLASLAAAGCGGEEDSPAAPVPAGQPASQAAPKPASGGKELPEKDKAKGYTDASADVKITACSGDSYTQDVTIEVTNSFSEPQKYVVGIDIAAKGAEPSSEARFVKDRIEPGQTITESIPGDSPIDGEVECTVQEGKRKAAE